MTMKQKQCYVVAVSGGVDSVALLDMLVSNQIPEVSEGAELIVAHFDHGIRQNSSEDARLVEELARRHDLKFELGQAKLGTEASEEAARKARYAFLRQCCNKYQARLITAHHQEDLIETMIINMLRGTSWRGLISLKSDEPTLRPLLTKTKDEIMTYAKDNRLKWHEDITNQDTKYLRNYVRINLMRDLSKQLRQQFIAINKNVRVLSSEIATELQNLTSSSNNNKIPRYNLIMWPEAVSKEVIYFVIRNLDNAWHPTSRQLDEILLFCKTAKPGKFIQVNKNLKVSVDRRQAVFQTT